MTRDEFTTRYRYELYGMLMSAALTGGRKSGSELVLFLECELRSADQFLGRVFDAVAEARAGSGRRADRARTLRGRTPTGGTSLLR